MGLPGEELNPRAAKLWKGLPLISVGSGQACATRRWELGFQYSVDENILRKIQITSEGKKVGQK